MQKGEELASQWGENCKLLVSEVKITCPHGVKNEDCLSPWSCEEQRLPISIVKEDWRMPLFIVRWRLLAFTLLQFKVICMQQQVMSLYFSILCFIFACTLCTTHTRPHPCTQPCKQGKWGEWVHLPRGSKYEWHSYTLDVSLKILNVPIYINYFLLA